ncbi:MAG: thiamine-phosphate kinase, partial [Chitinophagales bacterium]
RINIQEQVDQQKTNTAKTNQCEQAQEKKIPFVQLHGAKVKRLRGHSYLYPMSKKEEKRTEVNELGEFGLIKVLTSRFKNQNSSTLTGVGDDAAVIKCSKDKVAVVSTDMLIEGIHFDLMYTPLRHLGYKSVVVNLSDIYAMNAVPEQITVSIGISNRFSVEALEEFYEGVKAACDFYEVDLVGGDTSSSIKGFIVSVTAIGQAEKKALCYRNGAKKGDLICVSGDLGGALLGLQLLEREKQVYKENPEIQPDLNNQKYIVGRQLKPEARKDIIELFKKVGIKPTAMMDISDGLSSELMHICTQSRVGCYIYEDSVPILNEVYEFALEMNLEPITCAMNGGEDYELLFTIDPKDREKLENIPGIAIIGDIRPEDKGYYIESKQGKKHEIKAQGWDSFLKVLKSRD